MILDSKTLPLAWNEEVTLSQDDERWQQTWIFAGRMPRAVDVHFFLKAPGSRAELTIAYIGRWEDATDMKIMVFHEAPGTFARVTMRAVLFDDARLGFDGMLAISPDGGGSDTYLLAKALLLSERARAEIHPELEIRTNDVKASHGSSIGRIDEGQLFYLQSRGLGRRDAEKIILAGYFEDVLAVLPPGVLDDEARIKNYEAREK